MRGWIRIELGSRGPIATFHTVVHRVPRVIPIPLAMAGRLSAAGTPTVVHP